MSPLGLYCSAIELIEQSEEKVRRMKRLIFVAESGGSAPGGFNYETLAISYAAHFERFSTGRAGSRERTVEIRRTHEEVISELKAGDTIVFISQSWLPIARIIKKERPELQVVVVTSSPPRNEVHLVNAFWLDSSAEILRHLSPRES
ncbi:MAG: hypothetical protein A2849_03125 [Candidatus Taylorbacteria bacterium RIFCSPHIGHO2_01_FULL_51_15]|uniref:Uncharacterized protein n=1 Tax=Candidatus Taylorbacteria bacterium RIFCSPHIGHO2_01_FULL_51_15 TaxID=1802304 RepID=A0A1G2M9Z7_9BACT|nr:MAG: hypothetical protein A2849_03125 [Candidatus Taylorbacteria bacterium RIFCSPHIGHO2_01_FULL_51_15]